MFKSEGENRMIQKLVKILNEMEEVSDYRIIEKSEKSHQAFYVLGKLETKRIVDTTEYHVTIYKTYDIYSGSSSFVISHQLSKKEIIQKVEEALFAASLVKNKAYHLVSGEKKKRFSDKPFQETPEECITKIAHIFHHASTEHAKFNALEIFINQERTHLVTSQKVDLVKTNYHLEVEAIPSYDGENKVELYKFYRYITLDDEQIRQDAQDAIQDVTVRYFAKKIEAIPQTDIILKGNDVSEFFYNAIADYSYSSVYNGNTDKRIGDKIQDENATTKLNIYFNKSTKANAFDMDGVYIAKHQIVENGTLVNFYGSNQMAQYLDMTPSGVADELEVQSGKQEYATLAQGRYLEIIALSGIQIDVYNDYIGGEIRLAVYHHDHAVIPISGMSFSGSFKECLNHLELSKEQIKISGYKGPKYIKLKQLTVI